MGRNTALTIASHNSLRKSPVIRTYMQGQVFLLDEAQSEFSVDICVTTFDRVRENPNLSEVEVTETYYCGDEEIFMTPDKNAFFIGSNAYPISRWARYTDRAYGALSFSPSSLATLA